MTTHVTGFQSFFKFFASFCIGKLATSGIRVKGELKAHIHISLYESNTLQE